MHNSATLSLPLATPPRVPPKSEAALPMRIPISPPATVTSSSKPGLEGSSPGVEGWWQAQPEEDWEQGKVASRGATPWCWRHCLWV